MNHNNITDAGAYLLATDERDAESVSAPDEQSSTAAMQHSKYLASCLERAHLHIGRALVDSYSAGRKSLPKDSYVPRTSRICDS